MATCETAAQVSLEPVLVRFDRVYGNLVCYPSNQQAEVLARIAGTKTLLPRTLAGARALGPGRAAEPGHGLRAGGRARVPDAGPAL